MHKISVEILVHLIRIGNREKFLNCDRKLLADKSWINDVGSDGWDPITEILLQSDLECLVRGNIICARELGWAGGSSVAAIIWVFRVYVQRFRSSANALSDWGRQNADPHHMGARLGLYSDDNSSGSAFDFSYSKRNEKWDKEEKKRREEKRIRDHSIRLSQGKVRANQVKLFNESLKVLTPLDRLRKIAESDTPLDSVSDNYLRECVPEVEHLDAKISSTLLKKLDRRHNGAWGKINRALKGRSNLGAQLATNSP